MADTLICFVCNKSVGKIILFSEETLKKCQTILKIRKKHNLEYKDIILPDEYTKQWLSPGMLYWTYEKILNF